MDNWNWTAAEKKVARQAFDAALQRELGTIMSKAKELAAKSANPDDLWALNDYLSEHRREIDRKYDYRYSQLTIVFGRLLREKWLTEEDLKGISEDKMEIIKKIAFW